MKAPPSPTPNLLNLGYDCIKAAVLISLTQNMRMEVMKVFPLVCEHYIYRECSYNDRCQKLHLCAQFVMRGACTEGQCEHNHNITQHEYDLLHSYGVDMVDMVDNPVGIVGTSFVPGTNRPDVLDGVEVPAPVANLRVRPDATLCMRVFANVLVADDYQAYVNNRQARTNCCVNNLGE